MIHSMSGGILAENEIYTFVKVDAEGTPRWYLSPTSKVKAGGRVIVEYEGRNITATVLRTENCSRQTAPVPLNRVRSIAEILPDEC
ncbi:MAG: hypothetical protein K2H43_02915 [Clostridia bacterium]|nr:hypothetical protein [Clostridia bacterium]